MTDTPTWRDTSSEFIEIGKTLAQIEQCCRSVRATRAIDDKAAVMYIHQALRAARQMVRALDTLSHEVSKT